MQHNPLPWHLVLSGVNLDGHKTTCRQCWVPEGAALVTPKLRKGERKITAIPQMTCEFSYSVPPPADHLLSSRNSANVEGLQVSKEEHSKWHSQGWAHWSPINLAKPFPFWKRIPGMDVINKETDKNYIWMKFKHQQSTAQPGNTKCKQPSLYPEFTPFSASVSCAKLSLIQKLLPGRGVCVWMQSDLGQPSSDFAETPIISFWGSSLEIHRIMHNTGGK